MIERGHNNEQMLNEGMKSRISRGESELVVLMAGIYRLEHAMLTHPYMRL